MTCNVQLQIIHVYIKTDTADHGTATHSQKVSGECLIFI